MKRRPTIHNIHRECAMESITVKQFIAFWIPRHVKNKILQYLLESILDDKFQIASFRFGDKKYSTNVDRHLKRFLPFRKESLLIDYNDPSYTTRQNIVIRKTMTTFVTEDDISKIKTFQHEIKNTIVGSPDALLKRDNDGIRTYMNLKLVYTDTLHSIGYANKTELVNFHCGLILNEQQLIYAYHSLYENVIKSKYLLYNKSTSVIVSVSPLQMLWRIRCGQMLMKDMKELARANKIVGRSKLTTRADYIAAFMKL